MKIELTIKVDYLPGWGVMEGVRELLQNAKDAEHEFRAPMTVRVRPSNDGLGVLVIENEGCTMPYEALLLGHTTKAARGDLIGKFGEGFKLGILALLRAGHAVKIRNGSEVWVPEIVWSDTFGAKVLAFDIQKGRKDENRIQIEVSRISSELYQTDIRPRFLWLTKDHVKAEKVETGEGTLLLGETQKGNVYVKGILVEKKPELTVGYDLQDADVDRDRRMVHSYDFSWKTQAIWREAMARRPDLFGRYSAIIEANGPEAKTIGTYEAGRMPEEFVQHVVDAFKTRHGDKAVPVSNIGESAELEHLGRVGVIVNAAQKAVLEHKLGSLAKVKEDLKNEAERTYGWHELSEAQKAALTRAVRLVNEVSPVKLDEVNVVDFRSANLEGTFSSAGIQIAKRVLDDEADTLLVMVHEVAHRAGHDGEKGHVANIERIWSGIVRNLTASN